MDLWLTMVWGKPPPGVVLWVPVPCLIILRGTNWCLQLWANHCRAVESLEGGWLRQGGQGGGREAPALPYNLAVDAIIMGGLPQHSPCAWPPAVLRPLWAPTWLPYPPYVCHHPQSASPSHGTQTAIHRTEDEACPRRHPSLWGAGWDAHRSAGCLIGTRGPFA